MKQVSIVVPICNQLNYAQKCINSIVECTDSELFTFIIINNSPTTEIGDYVNSVKNATVIQNRANVGVARAWNQGILATTTPYVCIINDDILVTPDWMKNMLLFLQENPNIDLINPFVTEYAEIPNWRHYELIAKILLSKYPKCYVRHWYAACFLTKRSLYDEVGLFDEEFCKDGRKAYFEDLDFAFRFLMKKKIYLSVSCSIIHHYVNRTCSNDEDAKQSRSVNKEYLNQKWKDIKLPPQPALSIPGYREIENYKLDFKKEGIELDPSWIGS